jgi:hypothetical protein
MDFEPSTEPLVTLDATSVGWWGNRGREEDLIAFALVSAFEMIMLNELCYGLAQRRFTKEDQLDRHSLLIERTQCSAKAFRFGLRAGGLRG